MTSSALAREFFNCLDHEVNSTSHGIRCMEFREVFGWNGCETMARLDSFAAEKVADRDRVWCAAIIPEGSDLIQRVTTKVNDPAFVKQATLLKERQ